MSLSSVVIAARGIAANKLRSALTTLGILIGVASVILLVAVGSGSAAANREQLESLGSNTLTVLAGGFGPGAGTGVELTDEDVEALQDQANVPNVAEVVPAVNIESSTVAYEGTSTTAGTALGSTPNFAAVRNYPVEWGAFISQADYDAHAKVAVVGISVVKNLLGETADAEQIVGQPITIGGVRFTVLGVFEEKGSNGFQDQDDILVVPMTAARDSLTGNSGTIDQLTVQATSAEDTTAAQSQVTSVLQAQHEGTESSDFSVLNQASLLETQEESNRTFTVLLGAVAAISLLVGGIGVMNIMLVTVTERTREIGIRKAVGARQGHILVQFLVEAVLLAGIGGILGVGAGILGSRFTILEVQPVVEPYAVIVAFVFAVTIGLFFGIYPANRAASLRPIDALRYE
jgi:putative ABC transport system permease protein